MVSDFRKKKLSYLFNIFFDSNESKPITKELFVSMVSDIAKIKGWSVGDKAYKEAEKTMAEIWEGMQIVAEKNKDGEISLDEWISLWDRVYQNPSDLPSFQAYYCKAIFFLHDTSDDGAIDQDEFVNVHSSFGSSKEEAVQAFQKAANGKTAISWEDFQKRWEEYFISEDENAPGNFIFGNLNFDQ